MVIKRGKKVEPTEKELTKDEIKKHNEDVISEYTTKLNNTLKEKKLFSFWTFADRSGFKKIKNMSFDQMQKAMKQDVDLYKNRQLCEVNINPRVKVDKRFGTWLYVSILAITTDDKANMRGKNVENNGCGFMWEEEDFKVTKFSFKLLEAIIQPIADNIHSCSNMSGFHITKIIKDLKKKGIDLNDHLSPLANLI